MQCSKEQVRCLADAGVLISFVLFLEDTSSDLSTQKSGLDTAIKLAKKDMSVFKDSGIVEHCIQVVQLHPSLRSEGIALLKTMARDKVYRESIFSGLDMILEILKEDDLPLASALMYFP